MDKIYSRWRLQLPQMKWNPNDPKEKRKIKRGKIIAVVTIAIATTVSVINAIGPVYDKKCSAEAKAVATKISNEQATLVMKNYDYDDIVSISKDKDGNITGINSNIITINEIISDVAVRIQEELDKIENKNIKIALGSFTGSRIFAGVGPKITLRIEMIGDVETDFRSEFREAGINQTLHRIYLQVDCKVAVVTPAHTIEENISNQVILAENVIVGKIPNTYYNLEGMNTIRETMEVIQ